MIGAKMGDRDLQCMLDFCQLNYFLAFNKAQSSNAGSEITCLQVLKPALCAPIYSKNISVLGSMAHRIWPERWRMTHGTKLFSLCLQDKTTSTRISDRTGFIARPYNLGRDLWSAKSKTCHITETSLKLCCWACTAGWPKLSSCQTYRYGLSPA